MSESIEKLFLFEFAESSFGLPLECVREILPLPFLSRPPGVPPILEGFANVEGQAVPVLNPKRLFHLHDSPAGVYAHLLLLRGEETPLAILADRATEAAEIAKKDIVPVAAGHSVNDCVKAEAKFGDRHVYILSLEKLLLKEERARFSDLLAMEEERLRQIERQPS